ncbi:MAG: methyltransferase domain-containing protein [Nitrospinae bacterium]|nr:methyltransferase domain-containing protein [Nitrospinota bacterium]
MGHIKIRYPLALVLIALVCVGCNALKRTAYEGFDRNEWQHPEEVIRSLGLQAGDQVADLGSGSGYFTVRLASAVGSTGKVYAVDVDREMNDYVVKRAQEEGYNNVEVILAEYDDPLLPESGVDLIFTCNTYHHLENRVQYFANVRKHLRPNGRVAIVDFNGEGWFQKIFGHWTASEVIQKEMEEAGYVLQREFTFLPKQFFLVFSTQAS